MLLRRKSILDGRVRVRVIDCTEEQLERHRRGELVQDVFPHLSPDDREFIMTGITPEEWSKHIERGENGRPR
tara:strand:+ start:3520 stop:3735 length:216 start_codon:yes stop_codon:yes gene_type:complete